MQVSFFFISDRIKVQAIRFWQLSQKLVNTALHPLLLDIVDPISISQTLHESFLGDGAANHNAHNSKHA